MVSALSPLSFSLKNLNEDGAMDTYSKVILTVIMFLLIAILIKPGIVPTAGAGEVIDVNISQVAGRYISRTVPVSVD